MLLAAPTLVGCAEDEPTREPGPAVEPTAEPRPPRGAAPAECEGRSDDPEQLDLVLAGASEGDLAGAIDGLEALAGAHAGSATTRVRLGELLLRTQPPSADRAQTWFSRGLALDEAGCSLGLRDRWAALEGAALSRMIQRDYAGALPFLERSLAEWPGVRATRYNRACARCQTGDVDGCASDLEAVLALDASAAPDFLGEQQRPRDHYRDMARRDPDLEPLRADDERFSAIVGAPR